MTSGQLIREARRRAGITQHQLALRLDSHQSVIARWEKGRSQPDFETVRWVVRAAGFELVLSLSPTDDHDVGLIRRELKLLPHQRLTGMVEAVKKVEAMSTAARG